MSDLPKSASDKIPYSVWKDLVDMRTWWKRTFAFGAPGTGVNPFTRATDIVKVSNDTAATLLAGRVLQLENELLCDDDENPQVIPPWFKGVKPTHPGARFAVLLFACQAKYADIPQLALAQTSGICVARVNIVNDAHDRAGPTVDQHYLTSSLTGPVQILHKPDGTGEKNCIVNLSNREGVSGSGSPRETYRQVPAAETSLLPALAT